jgi:Lrp/AsnC family transcriptional regulator for asnA, asnC and gidA
MTTEIDAINAKILKDLLKDGRKSFAEIAKECNTSKDVIAKRYKQMKSKGIIVGATIQNSCACYGCNLVAGILIYTQPDKANYIIELVAKMPHVFDIRQLGIMKPSIFTVVILKNIQELDQTKQSIKRLPFVLEVDTTVWMGTRNTPHNLSVLTVERSAKKTVDENEKRKKEIEKIPIKVDETDTCLIEELATNGRMPFSKIGKELNVSTDTIVRRYERLKQNGDLKTVIQIDPTKIGYHAFALFNITFSQDNLPNGIEALSMVPDINFIHKTSGKFDCMASLMIKDIDQLTTMQEEIAKISGVTNLEITIAKLFNVWPIPREFISTF